MKFFCINIESAADHREHCDREFQREGIDVTYVRGFDQNYNLVKHENKSMPAGAVGCYLTHWRLIDEIDRYDLGPTCIFEDDIMLAADFKAKLSDSISLLPQDWDIAFPGWYNGFKQGVAPGSISVNEHWMKVINGQLWGFHAYLVNGRKGAKKLLPLLEPMFTPIDSKIFQDAIDGKIMAYFLKQPIANQSFTFKSQVA